MIWKYHNRKMQTYPWHREEAPHNNCETPERLSNATSSLFPIKMIAKPELTQSNAQQTTELEDLTVLKRSPDLLNNVKIGQDQLRLNETYFVLWGLRPFWSSDLKQSNEYSIKQPSDF